MAIEDPTFGCGTFLPGMGPGNIDDFDGGGTIDSGGSNGGPTWGDWTKVDGDPIDDEPEQPGDPDLPNYPGDPIDINYYDSDYQDNDYYTEVIPDFYDPNGFRLYEATTVVPDGYHIIDGQNLNTPVLDYQGLYASYEPNEGDHPNRNPAGWSWDPNTGIIRFDHIYGPWSTADDGTIMEPFELTLKFRWASDMTNVYTLTFSFNHINLRLYDSEKVDTGDQIGGELFDPDTGGAGGDGGGGGVVDDFDINNIKSGYIDLGPLGEPIWIPNVEQGPPRGQFGPQGGGPIPGGGLNPTFDPTYTGTLGQDGFIYGEPSWGSKRGEILLSQGGPGIPVPPPTELLPARYPDPNTDPPLQFNFYSFTFRNNAGAVINGIGGYPVLADGVTLYTIPETDFIANLSTNAKMRFPAVEKTSSNPLGTFMAGQTPATLDIYFDITTQDGQWTPYQLTIPIDAYQPLTVDQGDSSAPGKLTKNTKGSIISDAKRTQTIDLNDRRLIQKILKKKPTGIQDSEVAFLKNPRSPKMVRNETGNTDIFADQIDSNIQYVLKNKRNSGDWDSRRAAGVTVEAVYNSLRSDVKELFSQIRNYDGTVLTKNQIYQIIGTRILDGTVSKITLKYLQSLAEASKKRVPVVIERSYVNTVNEVAAAALIDRNKFTLDPNKASGKMMNILPNWKTLATDIDEYLPVTINGVEQRFYVKDDNTFVTGRNLKIKDGNYIDVIIGGATKRLFTKSEIDHAFILPEKTKQKALSLLGANPARTLEVSAPGSMSAIEFDYSLSAPRQNFYMLSAVLSSINTEPSPIGSFLIKDSNIEYQLMDTSTTSGLQNVNDYIKYKANHRVFILDDEDLIFDYLDGTRKLTMKQSDILFDSPKTNKKVPLLTRQIPWYIMIYPTNRNDYNIFNQKSQLLSIGSEGNTIRRLQCQTSIVPEFSKSKVNKFVRIRTDGKDAVDVLGRANTQARITEVTPTDTVFKTGYKKRNSFVEAKTYTRTRKKTGFRLIKEIITELNTNYLLGLNGVGKIVTEFDVFSRLYLDQFNRLYKLENFREILKSIQNGFVAGVRVVPPIRHSDASISYRSTLLLRRKTDAPADTFVSIKGTRNRKTIIPPTTTKVSSFAPVPNPTAPTTPS
jgi:hypothetical protein